MRYTRLILGLVTALVALWIIVGEQITGATAEAYVNARLVTLRAPVSGRVEIPDQTLGARLGRGDTAATLNDPLVDRVRLDDLTMERAFLRTEIKSTLARVSRVESLRAELLARGETFRAARVEELEARLGHARTRLALLQDRPVAVAEARLLASVGGRADGAADVLPNALPDVPVLQDIALDAARERVTVLEIALRAARRGVFLGDGYNDAPNTEQRARELDGQVATLEAQLDAARERAGALDARIGRERVRVNGLSGGPLRSPVDGLVWDLAAADGGRVQRGDVVMRLADCTSTVVSAGVNASVYNRLQIGQQATFRPDGSSRIFAGTVTRLAGNGARAIYANLAVAPGDRHLKQYDVTLSVPGLDADPMFACGIGRTGRVFFDARPLDWLRGLAAGQG